MVRWNNGNGVIHHRDDQPLKPTPPLRPPPIVPPSLNSENITELQRISNQQQRVKVIITYEESTAHFAELGL